MKKVAAPTSESMQALAGRIAALDTPLRKIASSFANGNAMEADDIYSTICEKILTQCKPTATNAEIIRFAGWRAGHIYSARATYNRYVGAETDIMDPEENEDDDGDELDTFEMFVATGAESLEDQIARREWDESLKRTLESLAPEYAVVVSLLAGGDRPVDIARKLGVSRASISQRMKSLRLQIGSRLEQPV